MVENIIQSTDDTKNSEKLGDLKKMTNCCQLQNQKIVFINAESLTFSCIINTYLTI